MLLLAAHARVRISRIHARSFLLAYSSSSNLGSPAYQAGLEKFPPSMRTDYYYGGLVYVWAWRRYFARTSSTTAFVSKQEPR